MAANLREGSGGVIHVTAATARTKGVAVIEDGWCGFTTVNAASGAMYALDCRPLKHWEIDKIGAEAKGDYIYLTVASNALTLTAGTGKRLFAKVVEVENGTYYGTPAGKTLISLMPQAVTA